MCGLFKSDAEKADTLKQKAQNEPHNVNIRKLLKLLDSTDNMARVRSLGGLKHFGDHDPSTLENHLDEFANLLRDKNKSVQNNVIYAMYPIVNHNPSCISPYIDEIVRSMKQNENCVNNGIHVLASYSEHDPEKVIQYKSDFSQYLVGNHDVSIRKKAAESLSSIAKDSPGECISEIPELIQSLSAEESYIRNQSTMALASIAKSSPNELRYSLDKIVPLLEDESKHTRTNISLILSEVSNQYPSDVRKYLDRIKDSLSDSYKNVRENSLYTIDNLSEEYPEVLSGLRTELDRFSKDEDWLISKRADDCLDKLNEYEEPSNDSDTKVFDP
jgi:hypothetical protein